MTPSPDWNKIRTSYPVTNKGAYLMNAAIGGIHKKTQQSMIHWSQFQTEWGAIEDEKYNELIEQTLKSISSLLNVENTDVAIGPNSSNNMNLIAMSLKSKTTKRHIVLPEDEFPSSALAWHHHGFDVDMVPSINGEIRIADIVKQITPETAAVVTSAVQFLSGFLINLIELGQYLHSKNIPFIVNATQAIGAFDIPCQEAKISALTATGHKWLGAGWSQAILMMSKEFRQNITWPMMGWFSVEEPWLLSNKKQTLKNDTSTLMLGSLPMSSLAAINTATSVVQKIGIENISRRILQLSDQLTEQLKKLPVQINSFREKEENKTGTINFHPLDTSINLDDLLQKLHQDKVFINGRRGSLRASVHFYNNLEDIERFITSLKKYL